jgi:4-hydroxy-3-methylbut-2-enyl diphosphate reductase
MSVTPDELSVPTESVEVTSAASEDIFPISSNAGTAVAQLSSPTSSSTAMDGDDFEASLKEPAEGDVIEGVIVHIDKDGILVDIAAKSEGLIKPNEISRGGQEEELQVGETVRVVVIGRDKDDGKLLLSKKRADFEKAWDRVVEALDDHRIVSAMVTERVKGGLVVDLGIRGFVPASHVGTGDYKHTNLDRYVGQAIPLRVIEVDREKRKVVLSNKLAMDEERTQKKKDTLDALKEGQVREGIVRRITDYGAFIDIGGIDGLLHVSEMSWARVNHPSDVVKVGDTLQVIILKLRLDEGRISLGLRQILPDPWSQIGEKYQVGQNLNITISRLVPAGAFVLLEEGIEAFIPNSELSSRRISRSQDAVNPGDTAEARIIEIKPDERKMTLSIRRLQEEASRAQDAQAREEEYRQFKDFSSGGGGGGGKRQRERNLPSGSSNSDRGMGGISGGSSSMGGGMGSGGGVTLGDVLSEQFASLRGATSKAGRKRAKDADKYDETAGTEEDEEEEA